MSEDQEIHENQELITNVDFVNNSKTYRYEFNILTVEQAELAREAGEFKIHQMQNEPDSFKQLIKSRGVEWLSIIMSYLLREVKNNQVIAFNKDKAESEVETWIKNLPISELERLRGCIKDFFTSTGKNSIGSLLLTSEKRQNAIAMLWPILQHIMKLSKGAGSL